MSSRLFSEQRAEYEVRKEDNGMMKGMFFADITDRRSKSYFIFDEVFKI